jgi:hypothetical protein
MFEARGRIHRTGYVWELACVAVSVVMSPLTDRWVQESERCPHLVEGTGHVCTLHYCNVELASAM